MNAEQLDLADVAARIHVNQKKTFRDPSTIGLLPLDSSLSSSRSRLSIEMLY